VQKRDNYDVEAFNLASLHDTLTKFTTLTNENFLVRMSSNEAGLYGGDVLELLGRAHATLTKKYGQTLRPPTIVEIFPQQKDFAVRTFGMPGNPGYLGVCFGSVITANSPASQGNHPVNWQAVLWHEFCHVVTLQLTRNKMPRWLSEGISVYEELQANPAWGQRMTPRYREMILEDELTPVSKLSGAFLSPPSELHLQFAYYESALVVEFLVQRYGLEKLKALLRDLGEGAEINGSLAKHFAPMATIEPEFEKFARERATQLAPGLDWDKPEFVKEARGKGQGGRSRRRPRLLVDDSTDSARPSVSSAPDSAEDPWKAWAKDHPTNFWVLNREAEQLVEDKKWAEAKPVLMKLVKLYPGSTGPDSAYRMLGQAHRELGETNEERQVLSELAVRDDEAVDVYFRLMELGALVKDWKTVRVNAERYLAVNPLVRPPYRFMADACERTSDAPGAIKAYRALLQLDPPDPADVHFQLGRLLSQVQDPSAKRHVLQALEEAPRYQEALRLLSELARGDARQ
jgi:hypothetical protein